MKTGMKKIWIGIILFYAGLFTFMALYDEKLSPEVESLLQEKQAIIIEPQNVWLPIVGGEAPAGQDPFEYGVAKLKKVQSISNSAQKMEYLAEAATVMDKNRLEFKGKMPGFYGSDGVGMIAYVRTNRAAAEKLIANNLEILTRHEALLRYRHYNEPLTMGVMSPVPNLSILRNGQRLKLLQLAIKAEEGDLAGTIYGLEQEDIFGKLLAVNTRVLITRFMGNIILEANMRFAADLAVNYKLNKQQLDRLKVVLKPFENGEASMTTALEGEVVYMLNSIIWDLKYSDEKPPGKVFLKPNAIRNRMYDNMRQLIVLSKLTAAEYANDVNNAGKDKSGLYKIGLCFLYDPVGEILVQVYQGASFTGYIERGHNLEGLRRLALLKTMIKEEQIPKEQIQQFLDKKAKELGNPYTGKAAGWEPQKGRIVFQGVTEKSEIYMKF